MRYDTNYGMDEVVFSVAWKSVDPYDYASFWWMVSSPLDSFGRAHVLRVRSVYSHTYKMCHAKTELAMYE